MDIKPDRMISLGYGKYWRSDAIVGLLPIEEDRGPGRRTDVYTATLDHPVVASRSQRAILEDMALASGEAMQLEEVRETLGDLMDALDEIPDVLQRMLNNEANFDAVRWSAQLRGMLGSPGGGATDTQNDLFE